MEDYNKQRDMIKKIMTHGKLPDYLADMVVANFDFAVASERMEVCRLRNRISGMIARVSQEAAV